MRELRKDLKIVSDRTESIADLLGSQNDVHSIFNRVSLLEFQIRSLESRNSAADQWKANAIVGWVSTVAMLALAVIQHYWK